MVKEKYNVLNGSEIIKSSHWSTRNIEFSLVNDEYRVLIDQ